MKVCSNTSPIIFLSKIDQLDLLKKCFAQVYIPEAVNLEFTNYSPPDFTLRLD